MQAGGGGREGEGHAGGLDSLVEGGDKEGEGMQAGGGQGVGGHAAGLAACRRGQGGGHKKFSSARGNGWGVGAGCRVGE